MDKIFVFPPSSLAALTSSAAIFGDGSSKKVVKVK